jgi:hypothetical protein
MQPFQQLAFASDIFKGLPASKQQTTIQPGPSVGSQMLGLGLAAVPAVKALGQP